MLKEWEHLPKYMQTEAVRPYYDKLKKKKNSLALKRVFDVVMSTFMLIFLSPVMLIISIVIVMDSKGGVFFRQERITQYGRKFRIFKFRTMVANADKLGSQVTVKNDMRVTKIGSKIRKYRIDELPQLINIMLGDMSFVGTRPETTKYVKRYTPEMMATLLLPAGVTSEASIKYKDEEKLLEAANDVDEVYVKQVLPQKMEYNLRSLNRFSFIEEILTMFKTVIAVVK
ncbi:MAG: sugar transferase [Lachnospiraceae bacterium]|nr:sugar transferase [Lachnospiraceae bacterium]